MPSPVSPDAGVPEHQPGQHRQPRRPQTGSQPGHFSRPRADQPPGPSGAPDRHASDQHAENGGKSGGRRDWIWSAIAFLVAAVVIGAVGFYFFGPKGEETAAAEWAVDSCAAPSAEVSDGAATDYKPMHCDDSEATVTVLEIQDAVSIGQVHCPAGTDIIFQKKGEAGGTTRAVCARNLSDDHPGDPGMGGGQLLAGDCVDKAGSEITCDSDDARKVSGLIIGADGCPDGTADEIELGFDAQRSYQTICLGKA